MEILYLNHYFLNGWVYFSLHQIVFQLEYKNLLKIYNFYIQYSLYTVFHLLQFLNAVICSLITPFLNSIKLHQIQSQFSTIIFPSKDINLQYINKVYYREQGQDLMQQKRRALLALHFKKNVRPRVFFNLVPKESFVSKCTFSIKFRRQMKL